MTEDNLAIQLNAVVKKGRRKPIGPIDLDIPAGYVVALVGPNGSGKSTLLHLMLQTLQPDGGEIRWFGERYGNVLPTEIRQRIAYVPEQPIYDENYLTAEEAGKFRAQWYPAWEVERFEELLNRFSVPRGIKLSKMSKGERRKFEIAAALAPRPQLLLLDEPSSGLDPFVWKEMIDCLRSFLEEDHVTILLSTHIVDEVKRLADYIVLVHQGQVHGMVEKDVLLGSSQEWWIKGEPEDAVKLGAVACEDGPGIVKATIYHPERSEELARSEGITILKRRALELDEILSLWLQGHLPEEIKWRRN
ncbi:ABC transporter ATP-binding protein [Paenibacillus sp. CAA11]|uniref:ABC transporter ATP-binding protein n=1 Tax=Paenibacillus sp. CAA11 TaxID=1532905 RepID=UPI000D3620BE|nr:ABC transporter ATP-binding protein [Paenibacillus sp. CAA11]AWB43272.1 ABC transporter ATP-binding protein [Paenibacillus sp. CAA11]